MQTKMGDTVPRDGSRGLGQRQASTLEETVKDRAAEVTARGCSLGTSVLGGDGYECGKVAMETARGCSLRTSVLGGDGYEGKTVAMETARGGSLRTSALRCGGVVKGSIHPETTPRRRSGQTACGCSSRSPGSKPGKPGGYDDNGWTTVVTPAVHAGTSGYNVTARGINHRTLYFDTFFGTGRNGFSINVLDVISFVGVLDVYTFVGTGMNYSTVVILFTVFGTGMYFTVCFLSANWKRDDAAAQRWLDSEPSDYEYVNQYESRQMTAKEKGGHYHRQP